MNLPLKINSPGFLPDLNPYVRKVIDQKGIFFEVGPALESLNTPIRILDLGCGNGHFLAHYLANRSDTSGLGVERRFKRLYKTAMKLSRLECLGGVLVKDVGEFLRECPDQFFDEVWWQFPDPWPKDRHAKHRMIQKDSFREALRILKSKGRFCFRSDCEAYWLDLQTWTQELDVAPAETKVGDLFEDEAPKTLFQQRFESRQVPIYSLRVEKN